jgi:hypothetical protein
LLFTSGASFTAALLTTATVAAVSVSIIPESMRYAEANGIYFTEEKRAQALTDSEERWRLQYLEDIRQATRLEDIEPFTRSGSRVLEEALAAARNLPNRQQSAIEALRFGHDSVARILGQIDLEPTEELCEAGRNWLRGSLRHIRNAGNVPYTKVDEEWMWIEWLARHCDVTAELTDFEKLAKLEPESPNRTHLLDLISALIASHRDEK